MNKLPLFVLAGLLTACGNDSSPSAQSADNSQTQSWYEASFDLNDSVTATVAAFGDPSHLEIVNGTERIALESQSENSYRVPVFDGLIEGSWSPDGSYQGLWIDRLKQPFASTRLGIQPSNQAPAHQDLEAATKEEFWSITFVNEESGAWMGQLILQRNDKAAKGTIKTPTGDLRHLSGAVRDKTIELNTFDGAHLYHLILEEDGTSLRGHFYSGTTYHAAATATRLIRAPTADPLRIQATAPIDFTVVSDRDSTVERWTSERFMGKVTLVDFMGTWCPNCMDAARFYKELQEENPGLEVVSVAFERQSNPEWVFDRFDAYQADLGADWPMVYGGPAKKKETSYKLHFLTGFEAFPTTLIVDKQGNIAYTHTGFNGPATGKAYETERQFFRAAVRSLNP